MFARMVIGEAISEAQVQEFARTIGPATSCGKNDTASRKSRSYFVGLVAPRWTSSV